MSASALRHPHIASHINTTTTRTSILLCLRICHLCGCANELHPALVHAEGGGLHHCLPGWPGNAARAQSRGRQECHPAQAGGK